MPRRPRTSIASDGRDRQAHRGGLLNGLGAGSAALGCLSLFVPLFRLVSTPSVVWATVYASPFAAAGLLLGLVTRRLARRHIRRMRRGVVDPAGERLAESAALLGGAGIGLALAGLLVRPVQWLLAVYLG